MVVPNAVQYTQLDDNAQGFTLAAWVERDSNAGNQRIFSLAMGGGFNAVSWGVGTSGDNMLATTYGKVDHPTAVAVPSSGYQHVAYTFTFNGTGQIDAVRFYLNGVLAATVDPATDGMNKTTSGSMTIGNLNLPGNLQGWVGRIDDLRIYNQELSANRIAQFAGISQDKGSIVTPVLVASSNLNTAVDATNSTAALTNGAGLNLPVLSGASRDVAEVATHIAGGSAAESWVTASSTADYFATGAGTSAKPTFIWDLGTDQKLEDLLLWQYQNLAGGNQLKTFELRFNSEGEGTTFTGAADFLGELQPLAALGGLNLAQTFELSDLINTGRVRFVEMKLLDNWAGTPGFAGGDRVGLGEIRFYTSPFIPEPATATLGLLGLGSLMMRRRRMA